jgi:hypothetical protein
MTLGDEAVIHFGNTTRQMLNLWGTELGIGIQDGTQYFRTGKNFAWYKGGAHNDGELDAGGGTVQMVLQDGHVGIGTAHPGARLQIVDQNGDAHGTTLVLGPMDQSNLRLGYHADYSWVQSHGSKPLAINPLGNGVSIGTTHPQGAQLAISSSSANDGNNTAVFLAPNLGPNASHIHYGKTGDWYIRSASGNGTVHIQDTGGGVAFGGELSFTARPFVFARYTFGDNPNVTTGFSVNDYCAAIVGFWGERSSGIDLAFGMGVYMYNNGGTWWVRADVLGVTERWAVVDVMFIKRAWVDDRR